MNKWISLVLVSFSVMASASDKSPVGTWQLVSAKDKNPKVVIELWEEKGQIKQYQRLQWVGCLKKQ